MNYDNISQMPIVNNILSNAAKKIFRLTGARVDCYIEPVATTKMEQKKQVLKKIVCTHFGLSWKQVASKSRKQKGGNMVDARYAYMFFAQKILRLSSTEAASDCNRDHTTALLAIKNINNYYATKDEVIAIIDKIKTDLENDTTIN